VVELTVWQRKEILRWHKELGLSPEHIAKEMDVPLEYVNDVISGKLPTTLPTATVTKSWREAIVTEFEMDKLFRFQHDVDYAEWERLYMAVGGTKNMAEHLWSKFHEYDHQILKLWIDLDSEQRILVLAMINRWKGL